MINKLGSCYASSAAVACNVRALTGLVRPAQCSNMLSYKLLLQTLHAPRHHGYNTTSSLQQPMLVLQPLALSAPPHTLLAVLHTHLLLLRHSNTNVDSLQGCTQRVLPATSAAAMAAVAMPLLSYQAHHNQPKAHSGNSKELAAGCKYPAAASAVPPLIRLSC